MYLDIQIKANPASLRELANYLSNLKSRANRAHFGVIAAEREARPWEGSGGEAFFEHIRPLEQEASSIVESADSLAKTVNQYADDIEVAINKMQDARDIALEAGLTVDKCKIYDPGPEPPGPLMVIDGDTQEELAWKRERLMASNEWHRKAEAFGECGALVLEARTLEEESQTVLLEVLTELKDKFVTRGLITYPKLAVSVASKALSERKELTKIAGAEAAKAAEANARYMNTALTYQQRVRAVLERSLHDARAGLADSKAQSRIIGNAVAKMPGWTQRAVRARVSEVRGMKTVVKGAPGVIRKASGLGSIFTALNTGVDVASGDGWVRSIATNGASLVTTTAVGSALGPVPVGGPVLGAVVGTAAGAAVSIGTGYAVDWVDERLEKNFGVSLP